MNLFKYYSFSTRNLSAIKNDSVFFANPNSFNDPFDGQLRLHSEHDELFLQRTVEFINKEKSLNIDLDWLRMEVGHKKEVRPIYHSDKDYKVPGYTHTYYESIARFNLDITKYNLFLLEVFPSLNGHYSEIRTFIATIEMTGVACFAGKGSDPKMWAHYAENHRGFCIQYYIDENKIKDILVNKVDYVPAPILDEKVVGAFSKESIIKQLTLKHTVWSHENEVRLISFLKGTGLKKLPLKIDKLCFGYGMSQENRDFIQDYLALKDDDLFRALPNRTTMRITWEIVGGFSEAYED